MKNCTRQSPKNKFLGFGYNFFGCLGVMGILAVFRGASYNATLCKMKQNEMRLKPVYVGVLLAALFLFGNPIGALAQEAAKDSVSAERIEKLEKVAEDYLKMKRLWAPVGIGIAGLAIVLTVIGIRNYATFEKRVKKKLDEKADEVLKEGLAERLGTTSEVLRFALNKFDTLVKIRKKKLLIVNSNADAQYKAITKVLDGEEFKRYDFISAEKLSSSVIKGNHLLIINDMVESEFSEERIVSMLNEYAKEISFLYFGPKRVKVDRKFGLYFANSYASLISRIEEILIEY
jgi:hypothetical protein